MDYRGEITRIEVMHHNLTHETIPFRSQGILTVRLDRLTPARHLKLSLVALGDRADGSPCRTLRVVREAGGRATIGPWATSWR